MAEYSELAKALAANSLGGAAWGALGGFPHGPAAMLSGAQNGMISGMMGPIGRYLTPWNPDAGELIGTGISSFPVGIPALVGGGIMLAGGKPATQEQLMQYDARDAMRAAR